MACEKLEPRRGHTTAYRLVTECTAAQNNGNLLQYWKRQRKIAGQKIDQHTDTERVYPIQTMKKRKNAIDTLSIMTPTCIYISYQSFSFSFLIFQMPGRIESQTTQMKNETCSLLHYTVQLYTCANYQRRKASIFKQCLSFLLYAIFFDDRTR